MVIKWTCSTRWPFKSWGQLLVRGYSGCKGVVGKLPGGGGRGEGYEGTPLFALGTFTHSFSPAAHLYPSPFSVTSVCFLREEAMLDNRASRVQVPLLNGDLGQVA